MIHKVEIQNRKVSKWLLHSADRLAEIEQRPKWYELNHPEKLARTRKWALLVRDMAEKLPAEHILVIQIRREFRTERKMDGWMGRALDRYKTVTGKEISRRTFQRRWHEAIEATAREALERKLL